MDLPTGCTLKSQDFQLTDFSKTSSVKSFLLIFGLLAFTGYVLMAYAHALTGYTRENNHAAPAHGRIKNNTAMFCLSCVT